jgi:dipeptidyl-peptidase-4
MPRTPAITRTAVYAISALIAALPARAQTPMTGAEQAAFDRHTSHAELMSFLYDVQARSDHMRVEELTVTNEGRVMPIVYLGAPPPSNPGAAWFSGRPTLFFTGNVHGNERAGREGSLQLIRELATGELQTLLDRVNVLIVPTLNPDGAENRSRSNSLGYDMNRDFIVAETPEITAVLEKILTQWWPDIYVDVHNGGSWPYNVTYQATLHPSADSQLVAFARGPMYDAVTRHLATHDMIMYWYSGPRRLDSGEYVWATTEPWARKQHTYGGLQNMLTLLFEIPGNWTLAQQADNARETMEGLIRFAADNATDVRSIITGARRRTVDAPPANVVLQIESAAYPQPEQFFVRQQGQAEPVLVTGQNRTLYRPTATRPWPWAYAFDRNLQKVADLLHRHAIQVEQLREPVTANVEQFRIISLEWDTQPYQNHLNASATTELVPGSVELPAGTYIVRMSQNAARVIAQLFEPDTDDSLVVWNFLDHELRAPGGRGGRGGRGGDGGQRLPIYRLPRPVGLQATIVR